LYDALDFSTDHDDGGGQTRESLSRIASTSAAVAGLDPAQAQSETPAVVASLSLSMLLSSLGTIIARETEQATEVIVRLAEERG
jgi:hypothetical protein